MGFNFETIMQVCSVGYLGYKGISDSMGGRVREVTDDFACLACCRLMTVLFVFVNTHTEMTGFYLVIRMALSNTGNLTSTTLKCSRLIRNQ